MDPDAMTTLLRDAIFNIEVEEYWEAYQHTLKNPYEVRTDDENDGKGESPSDDNNGSGNGSKIIIVIVKIAIAMIVGMATVGTIAVMIVTMKEVTMKEVTMKAMVAEIAVIIGVNLLMIKRTKMQEPSMKTILMMTWTIMMKT